MKPDGQVRDAAPGVATLTAFVAAMRALRPLADAAVRRVDDLPIEDDEKAHAASKATRALADAVYRVLGPEKPAGGAVDGTCCACGYADEAETPCPKRDDGLHCNHWWEGPS